MRLPRFTDNLLFVTMWTYIAVTGNETEECSAAAAAAAGANTQVVAASTAATASASTLKAPPPSSSSCEQRHEERKAQAPEIIVEGVQLSGTKIINGRSYENNNENNKVITLRRNGYGMRYIKFFGMNIRIYVASLYSATSILTVEQIMGQQETPDDNTEPPSSSETSFSNKEQNDAIGPFQFDFTFLRYVGQSRVVSAWTQQIDQSVSYKDYETYETDRKRFIQLSSSRSIANFGTQSVLLINNETRIIDQGQLMGTIVGTNFQRSFLSMWFGSKAVSDDLKLGLLRGE